MTRRLLAVGDIETTGIEQVLGHRIIEVAFQIYDLDTRKLVGKFEQRINPQRSIEPEAQAIHGIKFEDLVSEPTWEVIAPKLGALLSKTPYVLAHNGIGFDVPFIFREFVRADVPLPEVRVTDSMLQGRWASPDGALPNLKALCFACGVPYDTTQAHAAMYDTDVLARCFFAQFDRGFFTLNPEIYTLPPLTEKKEKK